jgi:hypothetical protein
LIDLFGGLDVKAARTAAEQVFAELATHDFPPNVRIATEWQLELEALANEPAYATTSATEIEVRFCAFVASLGKAQVDSSWSRGV